MPRPTQIDEERIAKAVRIPARLDRQAKAIADERQVSVNLIITWALEEYLARAKPIEELRSAG